MKVDNNIIPQDNQTTGVQKTSVFVNAGKKLKVALSAVKRYLSFNKQSSIQKNNKKIASRDITTVKKSTTQQKEKTSKQDNKNKDADITMQFSKAIEDTTNKKELKQVLKEINLSYMLDGSLSGKQHDKLMEQSKTKLKTFG